MYNAKVSHRLLKIYLFAFLLNILGLLVVFSATQDLKMSLFYKQVIFSIIGIILAYIISLIDMSIIYKNAYNIYFICLFLLILTNLLGTTNMGARRWLDLGLFNLQSSELMKIGLILALSRYYTETHISDIRKISKLIIPLLISIIPSYLIYKQPNLGTSLVFLLLSIGILFISGVKIWKFAVVFTILVTSMPIIWNNLHDYQKNRLLVFLDPERYSLDNGYNIIQSKIAIGVGSITGSGFTKGTQTHLRFLPEKETDFIFTVLSEETGFIGSAIVIFLFLFFIFYIQKNAIKMQNNFTRLLLFSISIAFFLHFFLNLSMISGILPVVGLPLPFFSYGGSHLLLCYIFLGFITNGIAKPDSILNTSTTKVV